MTEVAEILLLPLALSPGGARRLRRQLERDVAAGVDPGSRRIQIACLSASLGRSLQELEDALRRAGAELPPDDPAVARLREAATCITQAAQTVMRFGSAYAPPSADGAPAGIDDTA